MPSSAVEAITPAQSSCCMYFFVGSIRSSMTKLKVQIQPAVWSFPVPFDDFKKSCTTAIHVGMCPIHEPSKINFCSTTTSRVVKQKLFSYACVCIHFENDY